MESLDSLILDISIGKIESLEILYHEVHTKVFSYAFSVLKNIADAEDVTQDTFVNIYKYASHYEKKNKPMAWIITITKNLAYQKIKKNNKLQLITDEDLEKISIKEKDFDAVLIKEILNALSDEERQIVILNLISGLKHREIADLMNLKLPTELSKYNRAIKKICSEYKEEDR